MDGFDHLEQHARESGEADADWLLGAQALRDELLALLLMPSPRVLNEATQTTLRENAMYAGSTLCSNSSRQTRFTEGNHQWSPADGNVWGYNELGVSDELLSRVHADPERLAAEGYGERNRRPTDGTDTCNMQRLRRRGRHLPWC